MKKTIIISLTVLLLLAFTLPAMANDFRRGQQRQADSYYRMSKKAYNKAISSYGEDLSKIPAKEKEEACTKIRRALLYNQNDTHNEDYFRNQVVKKQIKDLRHYQLDMECPKTDSKKKIFGGAIQIGQ